MTLIKSYIQAFKEPFKLPVDFNRKKFWKWLGILIIFACLRIYPELYQFPSQTSVDSVYISEIFSYPIPYNRAYLKYVTNLQKYGKSSIYSIDNHNINANIVTRTYGSNLDVYSQQAYFGLFEEYPKLREKYPWINNFKVKLPINSQYIWPVYSNYANRNRDSAYPDSHVDLFERQQSEVNKVFMSDDFVKYSCMSKTWFGNVVVTTHAPTYDFIGVVSPRSHSLLKCVYKYKSPKISSLNIGSFNWQPVNFQPVKYIYTSNLFYNYMIMPPLKALALSDSHKQYNQDQQGQNNDQSDDSDSQDSPRTPEEEEQENPEGYVDDSGNHIPKDFYEDR